MSNKSKSKSICYIMLRTMTMRGIANYHTCLTAKSLLGISTCGKCCLILQIAYKAYKYNMQAQKFQACKQPCNKYR